MTRATTEPSRRPRAERPLTEFRLTRSVAIQWLAVAVVSFFAAAYCFGVVLAAVRGVSLEPIVISAAAVELDGWVVLSLALGALVVVPHELLHGAFMARYGDDPAYGVGVSHFLLPYAYARADGDGYSRNQLLVVLLAPLVVLTGVGLLVLVVYPDPIVLVPLAVNAAGSVGDLWMAGVLLRHPADVRVAGLPDGRGFAVYGTEETGETATARATLATSVLAGTVGTLVVIVAGLVALVFLSLAFGSGRVVVGTDEWLLLSHERLYGGGAVIEIGGRLLAALSLTGGIAWTLGRRTVDALE